MKIERSFVASELVAIGFVVLAIAAVSLAHADAPNDALPTTNAARAIGVTSREPVVGLPCEGCDAVFDGLPANIPATSRLAPAGEPGEPLQLSGTVRSLDGEPRAGVIVYAYQTDRSGNYPTEPTLRGAAARHGRLRGWVRTDADGRYTFETIRPGAYPGRNVPQHIHLHVIEPRRCTYYLGDVLFDDDPLLTPALRTQENDAHGGSGIVVTKGDAQAGWRGSRDITLGRNVADYAACMSRSVPN